MSLEISKDVYFNCDRKQLYYLANTFGGQQEDMESESVNRYAIVRRDTGNVLGIHTDDYIIRPYSKLAESVNEVVRECVDTDKYHITTKDQVLEDGKKYRRDINFWDDSIDLNNYKTNGMHIAGKDERIISQLRIYSSMDGRWG